MQRKDQMGDRGRRGESHSALNNNHPLRAPEVTQELPSIGKHLTANDLRMSPDTHLTTKDSDVSNISTLGTPLPTPGPLGSMQYPNHSSPTHPIHCFLCTIVLAIIELLGSVND